MSVPFDDSCRTQSGENARPKVGTKLIDGKAIAFRFFRTKRPSVLYRNLRLATQSAAVACPLHFPACPQGRRAKFSPNTVAPTTRCRAVNIGRRIPRTTTRYTENTEQRHRSLHDTRMLTPAQGYFTDLRLTVTECVSFPRNRSRRENKLAH